MTTKVLPDIPAYSVSAVGVAGSAQAFATLEAKLPTIKCRKFYGLLYGNPKDGVYRACVVDNGQEVEGAEKWIIPGGEYVSEKISDWPNNMSLIPETFKRLSQQIEIDDARPQIEFYRSQKELIVMVPTKLHGDASSVGREYKRGLSFRRIVPQARTK